MNILFNELEILQETKQAIEHLGLVETTSIQHHAIPKMLEGRDLIGQAQTGTGKTFAFAIPILEQINVNEKTVQALVICPTRELTLQVYKEFIKLIKFNKDVRITSIYGGESYNKQFKALSEHPHIVVATPGRTIDHLQRKTIDFSSLKVLVMDEADEMLKMGFQEDLETILKDTPKERQTALFSATIPPFIRKVAQRYQKNPEIIKIETPTLTVSKTDQLYYNVKKSDRDQLLVRILDLYDPASAIIFANTKKDVDTLSAYLQKHNYEADALHGDLKQSQRDYVMGRFRSKRLKFLIATDVAARGLDISHVDMVINYELPFEDEIYVHRIGRTGRAGASGVSISLVYPSMRGKLAMIERFIKIKMVEKEIPSEEEINVRREQRNYTKIMEMVSNNEANYDEVISQLHKDGFEDQQIISALLSKVMDEKKSYDSVIVPVKRKAEDDNRREKTNDGKRRKTGAYKNALINLGKEDGIRPVTLLDYFKKHVDLYPKNIGDIVIYPKETEFQIHPAAIKRLDELNNKMYNNKKIKIIILRNK
ncbi:DEAD/DEAH box helicase [Peloplasma aerotolerans]|jgi:ATP-dependent RNA helicase DeaD|uniref:DEAD/DEAH box helicase n=1 Tax=Peloplasma aerotolerans TaxID=3044389 RepID=A0AAW6U9R8_9MOLU|nr:DEAD/DEAH box helicase [Mariniplasma sp. M4Ah]MDI6453419.1 DEAD/DEAH box helicase [Mariniplasma sp. M4Ah]